jgi:DNA-binding NarL/FixJ family response regulator
MIVEVGDDGGAEPAAAQAIVDLAVGAGQVADRLDVGGPDAPGAAAGRGCRYGALRAGASGFLVKDMALDDILTAIRVVAAGDAIIAPGVTRRLIAQFASEPRPGRKPRELTGITDREREVLRLVGLGMSNAEIAAALCITAGTAKTHVARLLAKLGARDRVQLVITAYETGLVTAPH